MHHLVNPNLHAILIHYPLGLVTIGVLIELLAFLWRRSGFRAAGRWMILIGALAAIPAATSGMFAAYDAMGADEGYKWVDIKQEANFNAQQWELLSDHVKLNAAATILLAVVVITWLGCSDYWRGKLHLLFLLGLLVGVGLMISGAWHGGEMVYSHGTAVHVAKPGETAGSDTVTMEHDSSSAGDKPVGKVLKAIHRPTERLTDVVDLHTMLAGWTVALALVSLGLSIRRLSAGPRVVVREEPLGDELEMRETLASGARRESPIEVPHRSAARELLETTDLPTDDRPVARVPAARFWVLAAILAILTVIGGWVIIEPDSLKTAIDMVKDHPRYLAHTSAAVAIVVLTLILAAVTRWSRSRIFLAIFAILLLVAIAAQVWFGFLLLYDTPEGPITHINVPESESSPSPTTHPSTQGITFAQ